MPKPSDYVTALAYGVANHADQETVVTRQQQMASQDAPLDACYYSHSKQRWITLSDFPADYEIVTKVKLLLVDIQQADRLEQQRGQG